MAVAKLGWKMAQHNKWLLMNHAARFFTVSLIVPKILLIDFLMEIKNGLW
jgi:hypothetical protein